VSTRLAIAVWVGASALLGGWTQSARIYERGSFTPIARDACARPDTSTFIVTTLNTKVGLPDGPPATISATQLATTENGAIDGPTLTCRGYLQTPNGQIGPGKVAVRFSYANQSVPEDAKWLSEEDERRAEIAFRNPARYDRRGATSPNPSNKPPKWILRSTVNNLSNYLDVDNIKRNGNIVSIWHLQNSSTVLGVPGQNQFRSIKYQLEFNCATNQDRLLHYGSFADLWGRGTLVDGGKKTESWKPIADGEQDARRYACDIVY
jgi:hypothetical protein